MKCVYCGETYDLGPRSLKVSFPYYPNAEAYHWKHVRDSKRHQWLLSVMSRIVHEQVVEVGVFMKEAQRVRNNERARLKRLEKKNATTD